MNTYRSSRRRFLAEGTALGAATLLGGCGVSFAGERPLVRTGALRVINWPEYIDPATVQQLSIGATITYDEIYEDNVSGFTDIIEPQLSGGGIPDFDLIVPTNWLAGRMIDRGWVEALPLELITNHVNIDPAYLTNDWDRGSRFQMPWQAGITGIAYNPALTGGSITSIDQLFDPGLAGQVGLVGEMREAVGFAMLLNGDDPSRPTPRSARAGLKVISDAVGRGQFKAIVFDDFVQLLESGELAASMAWSGQAVALQQNRPDLEYVIPVEGGISWFDTMVIPKNAVNYANAALWMNWAYDPQNAAEITIFNQYVSPVLGVQDVLRARGGAEAELAENPLIFPDNDTRNRLFTWGTLDLETELEIEAEFDSLFAFFE
ncbi:MAG: spermidine/putrescine transport system substrate-binding protein [Verrucomicrobiales bacterium]|jgi:spermidine/putrescine transport system substrate-binding protein